MDTRFIQFSGSMPSVPASPAKYSKELIIKIIVGVVVVGAVGTGILLATQIWDPLWNPFRPEPEKVIGEMFENMAELETLHTEIKIRIVNTEEGINISMVLKGDSDGTDPENPKSTLDFDFGITGEQPDEKMFLEGQIKEIGENSYFKLNVIDGLILEEMLMMFGIDSSKIKRQWIRYDSETTAEFLGGISSDEELSEEQQGKIEEIFARSEIYYVKEELKDEKINGKKAYHYVLALNSEELAEVMTAAFEISAEESDLLNVSIFAKDIKKSVNEFFDEVGEITVDFWIGKKDKFLYKVELEKEINEFSFDFEMEFSNFDEPVTIEAPEDYKNLEDVLGVPTGGFFIQNQQQMTDSRIKSDMAQMRAAAEMIYYDDYDSYANVKCENELYMKQICDDLMIYAGMEPVIHQSKDKYCAYIPLTIGMSIGTGYCIDSSGNAYEFSHISPEGYCNGETFVCPPQSSGLPYIPIKKLSGKTKSIIKQDNSSSFQASMKDILSEVLK